MIAQQIIQSGLSEDSEVTLMNVLGSENNFKMSDAKFRFKNQEEDFKKSNSVLDCCSSVCLSLNSVKGVGH